MHKKGILMKRNILVIDDEPTNRFLLENILCEYNVASLDSGNKIWNFLENNKVDLILLDIMMPGEDGYHVAEKISTNEMYKDIPIIFLTAKDGGLSIKKGFDSGGYDYIIKPFDQIALKARIEKVMEKKDIERDLRKKSITDPLTNLYNRRYFFERLDKQIEHTKRTCDIFSIAILDIDYFKIVNDMYGHLAGDYVLQELANTLTKYIRPYDIVARYGGEEFIILFVECEKNESREIIQRIKNKIETSDFQFENNTINLTFSCGISDMSDIKDKNTIDSNAIIKLADDRLLAAKKSGRNTIIDSSE
jgi:two-component system, cell cycle response regulator